MRYTIQILLTAFLIMMAGCQNSGTEPVGGSDAELIQAIIDADKISVGMDGLPSNSKIIVEEDYNEYDGIDAKKAYGLGYEVSMDGKGHKMGHRCEVYFNLEGRKLDPNDKRGDKSDWDRDDDKGDWKCFDLVLPVTYVMPDGSSITVSSDDDNWAEIKAWYEANPDSEEKPALQYPVDISFETREGSTTLTVTNDEEMKSAYGRCGDGRDDDNSECFELVLPVTFIMPDGSTITVEDDAGWADLKSWYEANPDAEGRPELQYPVDIVFDDETVTINSAEGLDRVKRECWEYEDEGRECFELVYPVTFIMPDGSTITIENDEGWGDLREWYMNNNETEEEPALQYPVNISYEDGTTVTINSDEEMEAAEADCWDDDGNRP